MDLDLKKTNMKLLKEKISFTLHSKLFKNASVLTISEVVIRLSKFFVLAYAARVLGPSGFGEFNYVLALAGLLAVFGNFGLVKILTRNLSQAPSNEERYFSTIAPYLVMVGGLVGLSLLLYIGFGQSELTLLFLLLLIFTATNLVADYLWSFLRAREDMLAEAALKGVQALLILGGGFYVLRAYSSTESLGVMYAISASLVLLLGAVVVHHKRFRELRFSVNFGELLALIKSSWPVAAVAVSAFIFNQIDSIMLGAMGEFDQVGLYNTAYKLISASLIPAFILNQVFYPRLGRLLSQNKEKKLLRLNVYLNLGIYFTGAILFILLGQWILGLMFGQEYVSAYNALIILSVSAIFTSLIIPISNYLILRDRLMINLRLSVIAAIINIGLNIYVIPRYGFEGAAVTTLITYIFLFVGYWLAARLDYRERESNLRSKLAK